MKIAQYKVASDYIHIMEVDEYREDPVNHYIRVSEIAEVNFVPVEPEVLVPKELAMLEEAEKELTSKYRAAKSNIETRRANLRALTQSEAA